MLNGSDSGLLIGQQQQHQLRQILPFRVTLVTTDGELRRAVAARASAYLRHNAPAADKLCVAEDDDLRDDVAVLVARSKLDDGILGTIRKQLVTADKEAETGNDGGNKSTVPAWMQQKH